MERSTILLLVEHLAKSKKVKIGDHIYERENIPLNQALCQGCPLIEETTEDWRYGEPDFCMVCTMLDWLHRRQNYRVRVRRVNQDKT